MRAMGAFDDVLAANTDYAASFVDDKQLVGWPS
jgi:hypothetical protein